MQPIETRYQGYRFRSRLEARFAVFFDALNLHWEFEREGFDLGEHGYYLPDFYVKTEHETAWFIEIKGDLSDEKSVNKALQLDRECPSYVLGCLLFGALPDYIDASCITNPAAHDGCAIASIFVHIDQDAIKRYNHALGQARAARFEHGE